MAFLWLTALKIKFFLWKEEYNRKKLMEKKKMNADDLDSYSPNFRKESKNMSLGQI